MGNFVPDKMGLNKEGGDQTGVKMGAGYAKLRMYWNFYFKMVIHQLGGTSS